jgi:hypothetical protein
MKRLEHIRTLRNQTARFQAKRPSGAVIVLAQVAQERQRLEQEKANWEARVRKIDARLKEIHRMEEQLCAVAGFPGSSADYAGTPGLSSGLPAGFTQMTVKY